MTVVSFNGGPMDGQRGEFHGRILLVLIPGESYHTYNFIGGEYLHRPEYNRRVEREPNRE